MGQLILEDGSFRLAPSDRCGSKQWYTNVFDENRVAVSGLTLLIKTQKSAGSLQDFFIQLKVTEPEKLSAPEMDCAHGIFHAHPNGHHPISGKQVPKIDLMKLDSLADVRESFVRSSVLMDMMVLDVLQQGGVFDERQISESTVRLARGFAHEINDVHR